MSITYAEQTRFAQWIGSIFDQSVAHPTWSFEKDKDEECEETPAEVIAWLTRTFEECATVLSPFSDAQVDQGLDFLVSGSLSGYMHHLRDTDIPLSDRLRCIQAMETLFANCFAQRLPQDKSHTQGTNPLQSVCYIWWDTLPLHGLSGKHPDGEALDGAILTVLRSLLTLDSVACQESALFALTDWSAYTEEASAIKDDFLRHNPAILEHFHPALRAYVSG